VGAGPAGLAFSTAAAERGHDVTLWESDDKIGGQVRVVWCLCMRDMVRWASGLRGTLAVQFNMAKRVPGKEEFHETIRYFKRKLELTGVNVQLNRRVKPVSAC
jgi:2,4-dienoyl-CoA reductase (NADPH2)